MGERAVIQRADDALRRFFAEQVQAVPPRRADRLLRAEKALRACLDALVPVLLSPQERALLTLEEQFDPEGAAARVAGADAVLLILPVYLDDPRWHGADLEDRRLRIRLAGVLGEEIARASASRGLDVGRAAWVVDAAVRHETWMLRQERQAMRRR